MQVQQHFHWHLYKKQTHGHGHRAGVRWWVTGYSGSVIYMWCCCGCPFHTQVDGWGWGWSTFYSSFGSAWCCRWWMLLIRSSQAQNSQPARPSNIFILLCVYRCLHPEICVNAAVRAVSAVATHRVSKGLCMFCVIAHNLVVGYNHSREPLLQFRLATATRLVINVVP